MADELPATVPGPVAPADREAWYTAGVRSQYHVRDGVVASVTEEDGSFQYRTREPPLSAAAEKTRKAIETHLEDTHVSRPRTREGATERMETGLPARWRALLDRFGDHSPGQRRRLAYHLNASLRGFGDLTPLALDDRIEIADTSADRLSVHTRDFAPVETALPADHRFLDRFLGERLASYDVEFGAVEIPVTVYRKHLLGRDTFDVAYAVDEPDRLPGDDRLVADVAERLIESAPATVLDDRLSYVSSRSRTLLRRRLLLEGTASWLGSLRRAVRSKLSTLGLASPPVPARSQAERIDDLAYYVTRDLVGDGGLTVPICDPRIRSIEANRVGERVKVVPHEGTAAGGKRMPASLSIDDEARFVGLARKLAAEGGVELSGNRPEATVELERGEETRQTLQVAVGLPTMSDDGPYISVRKRPRRPPLPTELVDRGVLTPEIVAAVWLLAEHRGAVLFAGPDGADPSAALAAHALFIPEQQRPVSVDFGGAPVALPHETAVTLSQSDRDDTDDGPLAGERAALNPDLEIVPGVSSDRAYERLGQALAAGRGVFAAARTADRTVFVRESRQHGVPSYLVGAIDLVVDLPPPEADQPATGWLPMGPPATREAEADDCEATDDEVVWQRLVPDTTDEERALSEHLVATLEERSVRSAADLRAAWERRVQYVSYLREESVADRESLMGFLADLRTDEAATIERIREARDR